MESVIISQLYYPSSLATGADVDWNVVDWSRSRYCCCLPKVFQGTQQPSHSIPLACTAITFVTFSEVSEVVKLSAPPRTAASNLPSILLSWHLASLGLAGPGDLDVRHEVIIRARPTEGPAWWRGSPTRSPWSPATGPGILLSPSGWSGLGIL